MKKRNLTASQLTDRSIFSEMTSPRNAPTRQRTPKASVAVTRSPSQAVKTYANKAIKIYRQLKEVVPEVAKPN